MSDFDLVIRSGGLWLAPLGGNRSPLPVMDIGIRGDRLAAIAPQLPGRGRVELNAAGKFVSPPFVESHIHLDSALTAGQPRVNESGTLFEGIQIWGERKPSLTIEDVEERAIATLKTQAQQGVLYVRSHVDVSEPNLTALKALLTVRAAVQDWITLQIVAFPQDGLYGHPRNAELYQEAIALGVDVLGGIPHYELTREAGVQSVEQIFNWAVQKDRLIDLHCDEIDDPQSRFLEVMAACAIRHDIGPRATASHTTAFGSYDNGYANKLMGFLQRAKLNFIANPLINITLQGRADSYPKRRGITRVKELWQGGLNVSLGHDCIQDPWYSLGTGNMLDVASMAIHCCHMTGQQEMAACYDMITYGGAQTLQLQNYGLAVGNPADLIILDATDPVEAFRKRATIITVIRRGKILAETQPAVTAWHGIPIP